MIERNVGGMDRKVRIIVGAALVIGALMGYGTWMWIGVIPLATGLAGRCGIYKLTGQNTCSTED